MAQKQASTDDASQLLHRDSKKKLVGRGGDAGRRSRFKDKSKSLERGQSAPSFFSESAIQSPTLTPLPLSVEEALTVGTGMGHDFERKTYFQPTYCHHCSEMLWGLKGQGFQCKVCNFVSHEKCIPNLKVLCRHVLAEIIQDPVTHQWTKPQPIKKKKWCNVCRKKIQKCGVICEVCKYYAHTYCQANAFNNCKKCADYQKNAEQDEHHWIEGNLPASARCEVCTKCCASTECLTGFRCGWCGIAVHSACLEVLLLKTLNRTCTYRDLWHMILLPRAIAHQLSIHEWKEAETPEEPPVDEDEEDSGKPEDGDEAEYGKKGRPVIVVDGSGHTDFKKWRNTTVHPLYADKEMCAMEVLSISLRKCGISDDPEHYYLAQVTDPSKGIERTISPDDHPYSIHQSGWGPLKLYIRAKNTAQVRGTLRVNNSHLESSIKQVTASVTNSMTAAEIVQQALTKFGMKSANPSDYCLVEVSQVQGVRERMLQDRECPWQQVQDIRKDSLRLSNLQRYYLRHREGGVSVMFIHGLPKDTLMEKWKYVDYVKKIISEAPEHLLPREIPYDRITIGPGFPSCGGLFVEFPTFDLAMRVSAALEESPSLPKFRVLPTIYPDIVGMDQEPLVVFINGRSGGNQGVQLLSAFRRHLNPYQVFDLSQGGPLPGLFAFRHMASFRILIGGGDGTFGWVLGALEEAKDFLTCKKPPCGLLPLGTGNDLARALKWGAGYSGEKVMGLLLAVEDANVVEFDRWNLTFTEDPSLAKGKEAKKEMKSEVALGPHSVVMNNYFGIGLDAAIALDFHLAREEKPEKFSSRFHNKGVYLQLGLQKMISKTETSELHRYLRIHCDGRSVDIPQVEGIVFLNIQSWGAGSDAWGSDRDSRFQPAEFNDGLLEVVGISGMMHMGQIQSGIRSGIRLAQGHQFKVEFLTTLPIQVDGEAWPQPPGVVTVDLLPDKAALLQSGGKKFYSRQLSKKEEKQKLTLTSRLSDPAIHLTGGMSSRRANPNPLLLSPQEDEEDEANELGKKE